MKFTLELEALTFKVFSTVVALACLGGILLGSYIFGTGLYYFFTNINWIRTPCPYLYGG